MSMEPNPFFEVENLDGAAIVSLHAEQISNERRDALYAFADSIANEPKVRSIVVDLASNNSINSRMIAVLIHLQKRVRDAGGTIRFCGIVPEVRKLLDITRTSPLFTIDPTRKESLAALGVSPPPK